MKLVLYTNIISPHQLPLADALAARIGADNFRYIYTTARDGEREKMGWKSFSRNWLMYEGDSVEEARTWLSTCDVLLAGGLRPFDLFEERNKKGLINLYQSERWFKPIRFCGINIPGWFRLAVPSYRRMAKRFVNLINKSRLSYALAIGPWAARDFKFMGVDVDKIKSWGYFVAPSSKHVSSDTKHSTLNAPLRVLWVGRMLNWKRVDTIIRAVAVAVKADASIACTLVGCGNEKRRLEKLSKRVFKGTCNGGGSVFTFLDSVDIDKIRVLMREHDVYVLSSDGGEGWGAALSEALEENMLCIGTYEAGASAAILPECALYRAGDFQHLAKLLLAAYKGELAKVGIGDWNVKGALNRLSCIVGGMDLNSKFHGVLV